MNFGHAFSGFSKSDSSSATSCLRLKPRRTLNCGSGPDAVSSFQHHRRGRPSFVSSIALTYANIPSAHGVHAGDDEERVLAEPLPNRGVRGVAREQLLGDGERNLAADQLVLRNWPQ